MNISVLIEPIGKSGFRATGAVPFATTAEGATPEEAVAKLKESMEQRLAAGAQLVSLQLPSSDHPWLPFAGMFSENDPLVQEWLAVMQSRRNAPSAGSD